MTERGFTYQEGDEEAGDQEEKEGRGRESSITSHREAKGREGTKGWRNRKDRRTRDRSLSLSVRES